MVSATQTTALATSVVNNTDDLLVTMNNLAAGTYVYGPFYNPKEVLRIAVDILTIGGGTLTVTILGYDQSSGATWTVLASGGYNGAGLALLTVSPYIAAVANVRAQAEPPVWYQIQAVVATGPVGGTIGAHGIGS